MTSFFRVGKTKGRVNKPQTSAYTIMRHILVPEMLKYEKKCTLACKKTNDYDGSLQFILIMSAVDTFRVIS